MKSIPNGVYPTMITPYTTDNKIDFNAVEQLLNWYHQRGVAGVFAICQSSEIWFLSFEERLELLKFIMKHKPTGMTVVASGHTADDLDRQAYEANAFIDTGIDSYVFISNRFAKQDESDDVLLKNMDYVVSKLPEVGLGVYECPHTYNRQLTPYVLQKMAESGKYQFLKDTCCDPKKMKVKLDAVKGSNLKIYNANAATLLETMYMGCAGFSGIMSNFFPEFFAELCRIYDTDPERAKKIQDFVGFSSLAECQIYPTNAKYFLSLEGLDINLDGRTRNKAQLNDPAKAQIREMRETGLLLKSILL